MPFAAPAQQCGRIGQQRGGTHCSQGGVQGGAGVWEADAEGGEGDCVAQGVQRGGRGAWWRVDKAPGDAEQAQAQVQRAASGSNAGEKGGSNVPRCRGGPGIGEFWTW